MAMFGRYLFLGIAALALSLGAGFVMTGVRRRLEVSALPQHPLLIQGRIQLDGVDEYAAREIERLNPSEAIASRSNGR
jgi:hypothetical protein